MDNLVRTIRNFKRIQHSIECASKGITPFNISDDMHKVMDEANHALTMAELDEYGFITNKKCK